MGFKRRQIMIKSRIDYLLEVYSKETASEKEIAELMSLLNDEDNSEAVQSALNKAWSQFSTEKQFLSESEKTEINKLILEKIHVSQLPEKHWSRWYKIAAAAAVVSVVVISGFLYNMHHKKDHQLSATSTVATQTNDIEPGNGRTMLVMQNGKRLDLDSLQGDSGQEYGFRKMKDNEVIFDGLSGSESGVKLATLFTSQGGKCKVVLPDGSKVWLNAASSLSFPTAFTGNNREVTLTGEAYFEVTKNDRLPFFVKVKNVEVAVLGTHFDIMAYANESTINTTLLEGSVKVSQKGRSNILKPGQLSMIAAEGSVKIRAADIDEVMAWKNDLFVFKKYDFEKVMRQIERWYNVTVVYKSKVPSGRYSGIIGRNNNVSQVLKIMEASGVSFKIEGNKIIVE